MFNQLKRSITTVAVIAGVLAAAGPASASSAPLENTMVSNLLETPSRQLGAGEDVGRFVESQYVPTSVEVGGMAPNGGFAHARGFETEVTDYLQRRATATDALAVHTGGGWDPLGSAVRE